MAKQPMPTDREIQAFLEQLRQYRASLSAPAQRLLDDLVAVGLGHEREDHTGGVGAHWVTDWATTPWGTTYRAWRPQTAPDADTFGLGCRPPP